MATAKRRFHDDLQRELLARGLARTRLGVAAGLGRNALTRYLNTGSYPSADHLEHLIAALDVPGDVAEAWRTESAAGRAARAEQRGLRRVRATPTRSPAMPRSCPCSPGCEAIVKGPRSVYAHGHYLRAAPKDARGRPLATRERGRCQCSPDCPADVKTLGARYAAGHFNKTAEGALHAGTLAIGKPRQVRICDCGREVRVTASVARTWRWCSRECRSLHGPLQHLTRQAWNPLQRLLLERMRTRKITLRDVCKLARVHQSHLRNWFSGAKVRRLNRADLENLATLLDLTPQEALDMAGSNGLTAEEWRAQIMPDLKGHILDVTPEKKREWSRKGGESTKNKGKSVDTRAKISAAKQAADSPSQLALAETRKRVQSEPGRIRQSLSTYLRHHPTAPEEELRTLAVSVASRFAGYSAETVWDIWRPSLVKLGRVSAVGRPPLDELRCQIIRRLRSTWRRKPRKAPGLTFWEQAYTDVCEAERLANPKGAILSDSESLRRWWKRHRRVCGAAAASAA